MARCSEPKNGVIISKNEKTVLRAQMRSYHYFREKYKAVGWFGRQKATSSKCFETKFPEIVYGLGVLSQKMGSYNP